MSDESDNPHRQNSSPESRRSRSQNEREASHDPVPRNRDNIHDLRISLIELELQNEVLKNIRLELEQARDLNQKMMRALPVACFTLNRYNLIEDVNQTGSRMLGMPADRLFKRKFTSFVESADIDRFYRHRRDTLRHGDAKSCKINIISEIRQEPALVELTSLNLGNGRLQIAALEISAGGRSLSDLDFQSVLLDNVVEAVIATDPTGVILYWGKGSAKKLGWEPDEVLGKNIRDVLNIRMDGIDSQAGKETPVDKNEWSFEVPVIRPDRREIIIAMHVTPVKDKDGQVSMFIGVGRDVTRSKKTERELRIMEASIHSSINGIYITDMKGTVTYVNQSLLRLLGYVDQSKILGKKTNKIIENRQIYRQIYHSLEKNGEWQGELKLKTESGEYVDVLLSANTVTGDDCKPFCVMGSFIDISRRKKIEAELTEHREQLENLVNRRTSELEAANQELERRIAESVRAEDRIRSLSRRLVEAQEKEARRIGADLHDMVGSSLTVLKLAIHAIKKRLPDSEKDVLSHIDEITTNLAQQVRSLSHSLRPTDLEKMGLTEGLLAYFEYVEHQTGIEIHFEKDVKAERFAKDVEITIYRISQEAINNAAKYAGVKEIRVTLLQRETELILTIEDAGKGFDTVHLPPDTSGIFGMYDRAFLAGGRLDIESEINRGTRITCTIPIS